MLHPQKTMSHQFSHPLSQLCSECSEKRRKDARLEGGGGCCTGSARCRTGSARGVAVKFPSKTDRATRGCRSYTHTNRATLCHQAVCRTMLGVIPSDSKLLPCYVICSCKNVLEHRSNSSLHVCPIGPFWLWHCVCWTVMPPNTCWSLFSYSVTTYVN